MWRRLQARPDDVVVQRARPEQEALLEARHAALGLDLSLQATSRLGQVFDGQHAAARQRRNCHSGHAFRAPGGHAEAPSWPAPPFAYWSRTFRWFSAADNAEGTMSSKRARPLESPPPPDISTAGHREKVASKLSALR